MPNDSGVIRVDRRDPVACVRVPPDLTRRLELVAGGRSRSDVLREAIAQYVERREAEARTASST